MKLREYVRNNRLDRGWSVERLSQESGLTSYAIYSLEGGKTCGSWNTYQLLSKTFETPMEKIMYMVFKETTQAAHLTYLGTYLSWYCISHNVTISDVAKKAGVSVSNLSRLKSERRVPELSTMRKIASAMEVQVVPFCIKTFKWRMQSNRVSVMSYLVWMVQYMYEMSNEDMERIFDISTKDYARLLDRPKVMTDESVHKVADVLSMDIDRAEDLMASYAICDVDVAEFIRVIRLFERRICTNEVR